MRRLVTVLLVGLFVVAGCARTGQNLGSGEPVGLCGGWWIIDDFDEPDVADVDATIRWADGVGRVIDRIDPDERVDEERLPDDVVDALEVTATEVETFAAELRGGGAGALGDAWVALTAGPFAESTSDITTFAEERC